MCNHVLLVCMHSTCYAPINVMRLSMLCAYQCYAPINVMRLSMLCAYQCYAPLPPVRAIVGQGGDLINLHINYPNIRDIPNNQIPLQKVGDYWGFDTRSVTVQYTETVAVLKVSSEVIKCPTTGAASFGQSPYVARLLPIRGVVGHNIDRCIIRQMCQYMYKQKIETYTSDAGLDAKLLKFL